MLSLEALSLAGNIIQFIDFADKLFTNARALYKSAHQTSAGSLVLRDVANDLTRLGNAVIVPNRPGSESLKQLAQSAKEVAEELLSLLDDLQIKGRKTKWKSFVLAVKEVRNEETLASITGTITRLQTQMTLHLQYQIKYARVPFRRLYWPTLADTNALTLNARDDIASLSRDIQKLQSTSDRLQLKNATELEKLRSDLLGAFNSINTSSKNQHDEKDEQDEHGGKTLALDFEGLAIGDIHTLPRRLPGYTSKISTLSRGLSSIADYQGILDSFYFDKIATREEKVPKAHAKTFEWVFRGLLPDQTTNIGFPNWLQNGNGTFWVRGKAGSGKSTLMKFLGHHPTTRQYLQCWSGSQKLVIGRFYFWNSGTNLQKSQEGLLRSLIFEVLRQCPQLATHVKRMYSCTNGRSGSIQIPSNGDSTQLVLKGIKGECWTLRQLTEILDSILGHDNSTKFCFIIDGLDEYKARYTQDHQDLVNALRKLATSPNVKLCVSSRPWTVFMDAFEGDSSRCLKLEDLTKGDIRSYITDKLLARNQYEKLIQLDPNYCSLVEDVVKRSQGVFLWGFLVVRELLDGFTYNDTIDIMQQRLDSFPDTLEEFFKHMLDSVPKFYRPQTARIFQVSMSYNAPLPMILYSFLEEVNNKPHLAAQKTHPPLDMPEFLAHRDKMQRSLDAWCKGLLEIIEPTKETEGDSYMKPRVDFLHLSVRDFLMSGEVADILERPQHERLTTWLQFCNAITLYCRRLPESIHRISGINGFHIRVLAHFAHKAQKDGASFHRVNEIMLDASGAVAASLRLHPQSIIDYEFAAQAMSFGFKDFIRFTVLSMEARAVSDLMHYSLTHGHIPEMVRWLISCVEMKGLCSKTLFRLPFKSFQTALSADFRLKHHQRRNEGILDILRAISSTGYELDENLVITRFPHYYSELMNAGPIFKGRKRGLEDGIAESERKRIEALS